MTWLFEGILFICALVVSFAALALRAWAAKWHYAGANKQYSLKKSCYSFNIPLDETIQISADKAFNYDWFNKTHELNLSRDQLIDLLDATTKNQLFQFNGNLYEQTDGVAMGSPLGPLLGNFFMCSIEDKLDQDGKLPSYYRRYVDDTFAIMPDIAAAGIFLDALNNCHPSAKLLWRWNGMPRFLSSVLSC